MFNNLKRFIVNLWKTLHKELTKEDIEFNKWFYDLMKEDL